MYGPIVDTGDKLIKKTIVDYSSEAVRTAPREVRYVATPKSLIERDNSAVTTVSSDIDDNDGIINVADASGISLKDDIQIDTEVMRVTKKDGNKVYVARAWNNSTVASHVSSSNVFIITSADHALLDSDDDFGFNELYSDFTDGKSRNPTTGSDE